MIKITGKDYLDILNLVYSANRCKDIEGFINTLLPSIMQIFQSECVTFQLIEGYPCSIKIAESRSFKFDNHKLCEDTYYPCLYKDSYYQYSPLLKEAMSSSKTILKLGNSISFKDWERSDLYNNLILPQHLYWELFLTLRWKNNLEGMITLWRSKNQLDFEERDVSKAEILAPHLMVAMRNIRLISKINTWEKHFLSADEANSEGLLWLDHKLTPAYFNTEARDICLQLFNHLPYDTFNPERGELPIPPCVIKDCSDILDSLKANEHPVLLPKERILFTKTGKKFRIECSLIWKADLMDSRPNFIVTFSDLTGEKELEATLQTRFHLSRRELDVVYYLTRGLTNDEIAEKLIISAQTVHTHIKNIYKKLGAKSRIELYRNIQSPTWLM